MKKWILLYVIAMTCEVLSLTVTTNGYTWTYTISDGGVTIGNGSDKAFVANPNETKTVVIPASIDGFPVTRIAAFAFYNYWELADAIIPETVTNIGNFAFYSCRLASINLPVVLTSIGRAAFCYCEPTNLTIPESVMSIGDSAFSSCDKLTLVIFEGNAPTVGTHAFPSSCRGIISRSASGWGTPISRIWSDMLITYPWYQVEFDATGGSCTDVNRKVNHGSAIGKLPTPVRTDYSFDGWYSAENNGVRIQADDVVVSDMHVYAYWTPIKKYYTVKFDANGGYGAMSDLSIEFGVQQTLPSNTFTRNGYSFKGWANATDGSVAYMDKAQVVDLSEENGAVITLYAVWERDKTTISYNANGGVGDMPIQTIEMGTTRTLSSNLFTRVGYKFMGWSTSSYSYSNVEYADGAEYTCTQNESIAMYAVWKENTCTLKFDLQGGSGSQSDVVLTYGKSSYISYYSGRKTGFDFQGWALSPGGTVIIRNGGYYYGDDGVISDLLSSDGGEVTLFAVWRGEEYWLIFSSNGGKGQMNSLRPRYGDVFELPLNQFTRTGYLFVGWSMDYPRAVLAKNAMYTSGVYTDGQIVSNLVSSTYSRTTRLYAVWQNEIASPVVNLKDGAYQNAFCEVSLSCETGETTIYYTLDGGNPRTEGKVYKEPFVIWKTTTVNAVAKRVDGCYSEITTRRIIRAEQLSEAVNLYGYLMETDTSNPWTVVTDVSHDGVSCARSGAIGHGGMTWLQTSVRKAGTVSFWWKAACEEAEEEDDETYWYDYGVFLVDGVEKAKIAGNDTGWRKVEVEVPSGGKHILRWEYRKDGVTSYSPDCIWLDQVQWIPTDDSGYTLTTPEPVPYSWLRGYNLGLDSDFETAAKSLNGKNTGGKAMSVWQDYVAGTDPTNVNSVFTAAIEMVDGLPHVTWSPNLNTNGEVRVYTIFGKTNLTDAAWVCPTNAAHRFFKVKVEMP